MSKRKQIIAKLSLSILSPVLFLFVTEMILRLATTGSLYLNERNPHYRDDYGWNRLRENTKCWWYGCHYTINSQGFRMPNEVDMNKRPRIVALGDSITLGMGVKRTKDVWPNKLKIFLFSKNIDTEVINAGVQGWNLLEVNKTGHIVAAQFTKFIKESGQNLAPDIVVYCICLNDVPSRTHSLFQIDNTANKLRCRVFPEKYREWFKRKAFYRLLRDTYRHKRFHKLDFSQIPTPSPSSDIWDLASQEIGCLKEAVESLGAKLFCIIVPYSYQFLPANRDLYEVNKKWHSCLIQNNITYTDITDYMTLEDVQDFYAVGDYIHLNTIGHELIAHHVYGLIQNELLLLINQ